ncbi:zinc transporter 2 [Elysia marginata]|uniref:Zinc transporter 2 n=1 Tax=Elysia marginata TaxID=1093978 RepID=A0AAV4IW75_9GAST|nr:zinc transporter 2 [Elysia marginata]
MGFVLHSEVCCGHAHSHNKFGHGHSHGGQGHSHNHSGQNHNHSGQNHNHSQNHNHQGFSNCTGSRAAAINSGYDYAEDKGLLDVRPQSTSSEDALLPVATDSHRHSGNRCCEASREKEEGFTLYQTSEENTELLNVVAQEDHYEEDKPQNQQKNINVRAAFIHVVGDIIQSIGVLVAALIIKFTDDPKFRLADPICTFLFSLLVLITTVAVLRDTLLVMMEAVPRNLSLDTVRRDLMAIEGVIAVHSLHVWALTMDRNAISVHLAIGKSYCHDQVLSSALEVTQDRHHFFNSTIQVEQFDEARARGCTECCEVK